ncbi:MAG: type II toxin-antitoxin system mRNA interferase toxin, RelE/StbE family [Patescibacteria group bacterium]
MDVSYSPTFVRMFKALPEALQDEVIEKIEVFKDSANHKALKVHKLSGRLKDRYSFSVNYKTRIVFTHLNREHREACLLAVGDHAVYDR